MGRATQNLALHTNGLYKETLGWIDPSETLVINESGIYTLNVLESELGPQVAKIVFPGHSVPYYALEYRRGSGFDEALSDDWSWYFRGVPENPNTRWLLINKVASGEDQYGSYLQTSLLDLHPLEDAYWVQDIEEQATLNASEVFMDEENGLTISNVLPSADGSSITFEVGLGECHIIPPTFTTFYDSCQIE